VIYRKLGKTGLEVSQLGFGAMRLPMIGEKPNAKVNRELAVPMIHRAFEAGVNYIDTAIIYCNRDSQAAVGDALKGWRDNVIVSTKNDYYGEDEKEWWGRLENSLRLLDMDFIDMYCTHGINGQRFEEAYKPRVSKWMAKAKEQGLIKHICTSFHDNNDALMRIVDSGFPSVITLQYNLLDRQLEEGIAYAHEKGIGVVVMGPVGGGRLGEPSETFESVLPQVKRLPELALRFVLANPNVSVVLSGMSTIEQVEENLRIASDGATFTPDDLAAIDEHLDRLKKMADLYCTACKYCMPCPAEVNIPAIFEMYNRGRVYGLWESAKRAYNRLPKTPGKHGANAEACTECGECEEKCPQNIPIRKQLKEAHDALAGSDG